MSKNNFWVMILGNEDLKREKNIFLKIGEGNGVKSIGLFGPSDKDKQYRLLTPQLKIKNTFFNNVTTITTNADHSRIGSEILEYGKVTIDYKNNKFEFSPFEKITDLNEKILGMSPTILNDKIVVGIVWNDKLKKEIKYGDIIISLNGKNIENMDICDMIAKESIFKSIDSLEIEFKDTKGLIKKILLKKEFPDVVPQVND